MTDPQHAGRHPPFDTPEQSPPGLESKSKPDFRETSCVGSGKLKGKAAPITGGDSGVGRAVALGLVPGDVCEEANWKKLVDTAVHRFGKLNILVNNAAFQMSHKELGEISDEEFDRRWCA